MHLFDIVGANMSNYPIHGDGRGVMDIFLGNGHGDTS